MRGDRTVVPDLAGAVGVDVDELRERGLGADVLVGPLQRDGHRGRIAGASLRSSSWSKNAAWMSAAAALTAAPSIVSTLWGVTSSAPSSSPISGVHAAALSIAGRSSGASASAERRTRGSIGSR